MKIFKLFFFGVLAFTIFLVIYLQNKNPVFSPHQNDSSYNYEFINGQIERVQEILEEGDIKYLVSTDEGKKIDVFLRAFNNFNKYEIGDDVLIYKLENKKTGEITYEISDFYHQKGLIIIFILFSLTAIIIARKKGLTAIISVFLSLILFYLIFLKMIMAGYSPLISCLTFVGIITVLTVPLIHGFNKKAFSAIIAIAFGYLASLIIVFLFKNLVQTGNTPGEEFRMLAIMYPDLKFSEIVITSLFMGAVGALIDTAISISSAIFENIKENSRKTFKEIYGVGMEVGKDVLGSMINTLLFAYLASALPFLILLSLDRSGTFKEIINMDFIALELARTFVGAISLIIIIPVIAVLSSYFMIREPLKKASL